MLEDWDDEDAGSSFDCPFCDGFLGEGTKVGLMDNGIPFFYQSLICAKCKFSALTAKQYQVKLQTMSQTSQTSQMQQGTK